MPARKKLRHDPTTRERIRVTHLLRRLQQFALGLKGDQGETVKLSTNEIRAIEILLKKRLPDLSSVEHSGEVIQRHTSELSDAELAYIASGGSAGAAETPGGTPDDSSVH